ncbi:2-methoxy-6-polyprenyl-1,4-benzoquinol methylase [subsurface metagenome]
MRLSRIEFIAINNPIRRWIQKIIEFQLLARFLEKHNIDLNGSVILDAGCGSGYSTELIGSKYNPKELTAFDIMPEQIELAKNRYKEARFFVGDVTEINLPSNKYDAVFVFGILHHVPEWKRALREIYRLLKPKGVLLIEEVNRDGVNFVEKHLHFSHPKESRFDWRQFVEELQVVGFDIIEDSKIIFSIFHAYLCIKPIANGR